ncbi:serine protease [Patulibacter defluvii]|uniref:serine protease n=1 Tax=Patulibacter defluvii TaxID=3095358 RepID=UPI002A7663BE|nr:serine protease [Patulibacter sp. DM4]
MASGLALLPAAAGAAWAPASSATIRPGSETRTVGSGQCTSNFVFTDGADVLLGQAAHCQSTGEATDTNGCSAKTLPVGTSVAIEGATRPGTIVYSSWATMQANGEQDPDACAYNDLALIRIDPADVGRVNPSVPFWGGPTGLGADSAPLDGVHSYGNSSLRAGLELLKPKTGVSLGQSGGGWSHTVLTLTPGIPGDSGSAFLSKDGRALGTLSTLSLLPLPATNGVGDLRREVAYARDHGGRPNLELALGTEPFSSTDAERAAREVVTRLGVDLQEIASGRTVERLLRTVGGLLG